MTTVEAVIDDRFTPEGKHRRDPKRQRATFGVEYPSRDRVFEKKTDIPHSQEKVLGHRLTFPVQRQTFTDVEFEECNFHNKHGADLASIAHLTFDRCRFRRSFMGTTRYAGCRFRHCTFTRCDFSFVEFDECTFEECEFVECTASEAVFERTEIDADEFMAGLEVPLYNYDQGLAERERAQLSEQIDDVRFRVASRLVRASLEVSHRFYADTALRHLKWQELRYRKNRLRRHSWYSIVGRSIALAWAYLVYFATAGGTSLVRPILLLSLLAFLASLFLPVECVSYQDAPLSQHNLVSRFLISLTLVLGFGFDSFEACRPSALGSLVGISTAGFVVLALLASVIVRRVYR